MKIKINMIPVPKARARVVRNKKTGAIFSYTPSKTVEAEEKIKYEYISQKGEKYFNGEALMLEVVFGLPKPKSIPKRFKRMNLVHNKKPDLDNLLKLLKDALRGIAYRDDSQIWHIKAIKVYTDEPFINFELKKREEKVLYLCNE
jgi:Holliday junction resolvase RusA-like endonuclease